MRLLLMFITLVLSSATYAACEGGICKLTINVLKDKGFQHAVMTANKSLALGDSVVLKTEKDFASVVSYGDLMYVGKEVTLGNLYHQGVLLLENPAHVHGKIYAQVPDNVKNLVTNNFIKPNIEHVELTSTIDFPKNNKIPEMTIDKATTMKLNAGRYGKVVVQKGKLQLASGIYFFESLVVGVDGTIEVDNKKGTAFVFVLENLQFSGLMNFHGTTSDLLVGYFGKNPVVIDGKFDAYLVASGAEVVLFPAPNNQFHNLSIFAQSIDVKSGTKVIRAIPTYKGDAFEEIVKRNVPADDEYATEGSHDPQYLKGLADLPNGKLILEAIESFWGSGPESRLKYEEILELLRENPEMTVATFKKIMGDIPERVDSIADRESLVIVLADLKVDQAMPLLSDIGNRPVNQEILAAHSGHQDSNLSHEYGIRGYAFNGLGKLVKNGNSAAEQILLNTTLKESDYVIKDAAAVAYLLSGNIEQKREQLRESLPASDQYLADITFDVGPLNDLIEKNKTENSVPAKNNFSDDSPQVNKDD